MSLFLGTGVSMFFFAIFFIDPFWLWFAHLVYSSANEEIQTWQILQVVQVQIRE